MNEMMMLLWKDFRLSRLCLLAGVLFIIIPYICYFVPYIDWMFPGAWYTSTILSQLTMALVAGNIIACERVDRSAEFLAFQGATQKMIITSKLMICTITFISIWVIALYMRLWLKLNPEEFVIMRMILIMISAAGFCVFGCCWLLSVLLTNVVANIVFGLISPLFVGLGLGLTGRYLHWPNEKSYEVWFSAVCVMVGFISLVAGTWYFIKSKES